MSVTFEQIDVSDWTFVRTETIGQSPADWVRHPDEEDVATNHWLFKPVEVHQNGSVQGGDWAEKIVSELAIALEIPTATIELARRNGVRGSISRNVIPQHWDMWSGRLWLDANTEIGYSSAANTNSKRPQSFSTGYSLENIRLSLNDVAAPPGFRFVEGLSGYEVFCGYLLLDALVANRDRHEDNWGVLQPTVAPRTSTLSPAFDNAGSLGYQLTDERRERQMNVDNGVQTWAERGTAWRFEPLSEQSVPTLVELAVQAVNLLENPETFAWVSKLDTLTSEFVGSVVDRVPEMSAASRRFAYEVVMVNLGRVRDGYRNVAA